MNPELGCYSHPSGMSWWVLSHISPLKTAGIELARPSGASDSLFPKLEKELTEDASSSWRLRRMPNSAAIAVTGPKPQNRMKTGIAGSCSCSIWFQYTVTSVINSTQPGLIPVCPLRWSQCSPCVQPASFKLDWDRDVCHYTSATRKPQEEKSKEKKE